MRLKAVSGIMLTLLLIGMLTFAFDVQPVRAEFPQHGKIGTTMLPPPLNGSASEENSNYPCLKELANGEETSSSSCNEANKIDPSRTIDSEHTGRTDDMFLYLGNHLNLTSAEKGVEKPTMWYSPDDDLPTMFNQTEKPSNLFSIELRCQTYFTVKTSSNFVCILVDSSVYGGIETSIGQFIADVEASGFSVELYSGSWGTAEDTREFLHAQLSYGIVGAILVGDIPSAWYEMDNPDPWGYEEFPIDLYYMDLDGTWTDSDDDGLYDTHSGDVEPEIWVGRLKASNIFGDEVSLLNNYFRKNHCSRNGTLSVPQRALVYVDDDWVKWADEDNNALRQLYSQTTLVKDNATTNAEDYKTRITQGYEWVHLRCHGSSGGHTFMINGVWDGTVYSSDYLSIDPAVLFYQLFVCSGARYVEQNYLGGACIFADTYGILAVGSTKTGGMLVFEDFYGPLSEGKYIGAAFREWFQNWGEYDPKWFYGLTILGDPTLYLPRMTHELDVTLETPIHLEPGDSSLLEATVFNNGLNNESDVELFLMINGTTVENGTILELVKGASYAIRYLWTPTIEGVYNVTAYAPPVPGESVTENNMKSASVHVQVLPDLLIVDDNDGNSWINGTSLPEFQSALTTADYEYWVWSESTMGNPPLDFLTKFKLVIWTCGDYWNDAVDPVDVATLESYLAHGGSLLLEGEDIGYDHHDDDFMVNVAHAIYQVDSTGAPGLKVTNPTHPVVEGLPSNFTWTTYPPFDDGVAPTNTGMEVIQYTGTNWTAVTVFEGTVSKVVYCAFPLYCLGGFEQETLAINSVNWLLETPRAFGWVDDRRACDEPSIISERKPVMATDSNGHSYVAYERYDPESEFYEIYVAKSMDNGDTWSIIGSVYDYHVLGNASIAIDVGDNNNIFVAFEREWTSTDYDVFVLRYMDGSWDVSEVANTLGSNDRYPSITSEYQHGTDDWQCISYEYVWSSNDRDLMFAWSEDDGETWGKKKLHGWFPDGNVHCQTSIATTRGSDGYDYIYIAYKWGADYSTAYDIVIDKSKDRGKTWTQEWVCDESSRDKNWPSITATHGGGTVVIAWHVYWDSIYLNDVQYAFSTGNGDSWYVGWLALEVDVNEETPTLTVDGQDSTSTSVYGCVHVVYWRENEIYYQEAPFSSPWWWTSAEAVTDAAAYVSAVYTKPAITTYRSVSGRYLPAVAWTDLRNGSYDIYYSTKGPMHTIDSSPPERTVEIDGESYSAPAPFYWIEGSTHTVNAPSPQYVNSEVRHVFENWSDGGAQSHIITAGLSDQNITAYFNIQYYLSVTTNPSELTPQPIVTPPRPWYDNGTLVTCTAQAVGGYIFSHWTVDEINRGQGINPITITMNEPHTAIAHYLARDIAVTNVASSKTIVGQNYSLSINVTVENQGGYPETFNVTLYTNTTIIATFTNITLPRGNSTTITFLWNTTGFAKGVYTISANATLVQGETDTTDNSYTGGTVRVNMVGDIVPEYGLVDIVDVVYVAIHFGAKKGEPNYDPIADIDGNGIIDIVDIVIIAIHFGEKDP